MSSPVLSQKTFNNLALGDNEVMEDSDSIYGDSRAMASDARTNPQAMTIEGTVNKAFTLFAIVAFVAIFSWVGALNGLGSLITVLCLGSIPVTLGIAIFLAFKPQYAKVLSIIYAISEGFTLGLVSLISSEGNAGIIVGVLTLTFGIAFAMLALYRSGLISVNEKFRSIMFSALSGITLCYLVGLFATALGFPEFSVLSVGGTYGLIINIIVAGVAALSFLLDFDNIEYGVSVQAPKYMEWYCAFSLLVTLIWLYLEILRSAKKR